MAKRAKDILEGTKFGRLTVIGPAERRNERYLYVPVKCRCGTVKHVERSVLRKGKVNSCGCLNAEIVSARTRTHGRRGTPIYAVWNVMLQRCYNKNNRQYSDYGGRGITVCSEWHAFENFFRDMGDPPFEGATLERRHNNKGYSPSNCIWATRSEQMRNRRNAKMVSYQGMEIGLPDLLDILGRGAEYGKIYQRLHSYGWSLDRAIHTP